MLVPCGPADKNTLEPDDIAFSPEVRGQQADDPFRRDGHVWRRL